MHRTHRTVPSFRRDPAGLALLRAAAAPPTRRPRRHLPRRRPPPGYSAGLQVGEGMRRAGLPSDFDIDSFIRGVKDALAGRSVDARGPASA